MLDKHTKQFLLSKMYDDIHQLHKTLEVVLKDTHAEELDEAHRAVEEAEYRLGVVKEKRKELTDE